MSSNPTNLFYQLCPHSEIFLLSDVPQFTDTLIDLNVATWTEKGYYSGVNPRQDWERIYHPDSTDASRALATVVLVVDETLVGCLSVRPTDDISDSFPELSPWVADIIVLESCRGLGYGRKLCEAIDPLLTHLAIPEAFLYTDSQVALYQKFGWETLAEHPFAGRTVFVMSRKVVL